MNNSTLYQLSFEALDKHIEAIEEMLVAAGALSVSTHTDSDQAIFQQHPDEQPLWKNNTIIALYDKKTFNMNVLTIIKHTLQLPHPIQAQIETVTNQDWVSLTQSHFQPQCYNNKLWVCPSWHQPPDSEAVVMLDPGLAFGTGTHPTTQLCLEWLAQNPPYDLNVIDYGCGSGILALAAIALGANAVWATDHDPQALEASTNNAKLNHNNHRDSLHIVTTDAITIQTAPLVLANILANPLVELKPQLQQLLQPHGRLILSGILESEVDKIRQAYLDSFIITDISKRDEWVRINLQKID